MTQNLLALIGLAWLIVTALRLGYKLGKRAVQAEIAVRELAKRQAARSEAAQPQDAHEPAWPAFLPLP